MKQEIKQVFYCDFCKKRLFRQSAMVSHERSCNKNPLNCDQCMNCDHCETIQVEYVFQAYYDGHSCQDTKRTTTGYKCNSFGKELYPYRAAKMGLPSKFPDTFEGKEQMPNSECPNFKKIDLQEFFNRGLW